MSETFVSLYNPADDMATFPFGGVDYDLAPNTVTDLPEPAAAYFLAEYGRRGLRLMPAEADAATRKRVIEEAEEVHADWLRATYGPILAKHDEAVAQSKRLGLKEPPAPLKVSVARAKLAGKGILTA